MAKNNHVLIRLNLEELEQMKARMTKKQLEKLTKNQSNILANRTLYYDQKKMSDQSHDIIAEFLFVKQTRLIYFNCFIS